MKTKVIASWFECDVEKYKISCLNKLCDACPCNFHEEGYIDGYTRGEAVIVFKDRIEMFSIEDNMIKPIGFMNEAEINAFLSNPIDAKDE